MARNDVFFRMNKSIGLVWEKIEAACRRGCRDEAEELHVLGRNTQKTHEAVFRQ